MIIELKNLKRKDLLKLPMRRWDEETTYDFVLISSTGQKHDSGYAIMMIVGCNYKDKVIDAEISAYCDDIGWSMPIKHPYNYIRPDINKNVMRTDCLYPSGIIRMWGSGEHNFKGKFKVGISLSSTEVELVVIVKPKKLENI